MSDLRLFFQRRRKLFTRVGALVALGVGGLLAVTPMPMADANESDRAEQPGLSDPMRLLLSPAPMSSERFLAYYAIAYR